MEATEGVSGGHRAAEVAFGSGVKRLMFPLHTAPTRLGIEQGLRGEPHRGPGCYSPDPVTSFLRPLDSVPRSTRGWYFGATQASRASRITQRSKPGPSDYQRIEDKDFGESYKPFNATCPRWDGKNKKAENLGPGTYEHDVVQSRHVEFEESFGYGRKLRSPVAVKCTKGIPDQCEVCRQDTVGDYYQKGKSILCSKCHDHQQQELKRQYNRDLFKQYRKVRDCRGLHKHDFPGKDPKIILKSESELKKLRYKEAYLRLYYSD